MQKLQILLVFIILFFSIVGNSYGQMIDTIYYDQEFKQIEVSKRKLKKKKIKYEYYRVYEADSLSGFIKVIDYYKNGVIQMKGHFQSINFSNKEGVFEWFDKNGKADLTCNYANNILHGECQNWDGNLRDIGWYVNGKKEGVWNYYFDTGQQCAKLAYENGELIGEKYWEKDGTLLKDLALSNKEPKYTSDTPLDAFIESNIVYPIEAKENGITGVVYIGIIVKKDGSMKARVLQSIGDRSIEQMMDKEALRVVSLTKDYWEAGKRYNRFENIEVTIPVVFVLH